MCVLPFYVNKFTKFVEVDSIKKIGNMKKIGLLLVLFGFMSHATFSQELEKEISGVSQNIQQQKIEIANIPDKVAKVLKSKFATYTVAKAVKGKLKGKPVYKVKLENKDAFQIVILDANGKILESEKNMRKQ